MSAVTSFPRHLTASMTYLSCLDVGMTCPHSAVVLMMHLQTLRRLWLQLPLCLFLFLSLPVDLFPLHLQLADHLLLVTSSCFNQKYKPKHALIQPAQEIGLKLFQILFKKERIPPASSANVKPSRYENKCQGCQTNNWNNGSCF